MLRLMYLVYKLWLFIARPLTLGVRVMLIRNGKVLLVRQSYMKGWFMPGGGVKRGETLEQAARREAREEVGADLKNISLFGAYSNFAEWKSDHNIVFLSHDFKLTGSHDYEVAELRWFPLYRLPSGLWPGHRRRLEEYRSWLRRRPSAGRRQEGPAELTRFGEW
jgi:ADP-ribose pyrophosphatase YjhB (NUDIX family)